jgi:hypothetical protein
VRVVESQYVTATRKLVDSDAEQALLEELIDRAKPPVPAGMGRLHYLLFTPFRHPPLRNGSRFGTRAERGIFYASAAPSVALAEVAYYRLVFLEGSRAELGLLQTEHTAFTVKIAAKKYLDLTKPPFAAFKAQISAKAHYAHAQQLGADLRAAGIDAFAYGSSRDPHGGNNYALLKPVFAAHRPSGFQGWACSATRDLVEFREKSFVSAPAAHSFARHLFLVGGKLPAPAC